MANDNGGVTFSAAEFVCVMAMMNAYSVVGIESPDLFPPEGSAHDAMLETGFAQLQQHGWLTPGARPGRYRLADALVEIAAVIADPIFVVFTIKQCAGHADQLALHYLAEPVIAELTITADKAYRLGVVPDRGALAERIGLILGLSSARQLPASRFMLDENVLQDAQRCASSGQPGRAIAILRESGLDDASSSTLAAAAPCGQVVVVRVSGGQVLAGHKASVFCRDGATYLTRREDAHTTKLLVEPVQNGALRHMLSEYIAWLLPASLPQLQ